MSSVALREGAARGGTGSAIRIRDLSRRFPGATRASVDSVSLDVAPGETLCVVGPSGCGKSTTLRLIAGLERPDSGHIFIDGRDVAAVAPQARDVAMVFQGFALYPHLTARDNLAFPLRMRGVARAERERTLAEVAELLGISALMARYPAELSGGERQRVAMGRALVRRPKVFLFDEPLSNLDAALRAELRVELGRLLRSLGTTAVYVTHDQVEAMTLGHRIAVMREGRLEQLDTPRRLYEAPATTFVAAFFGSPPMNLLDGERDGDWVRAGPFRFEAPRGHGSVSRFVVGLRPEDLQIGETGGTVAMVSGRLLRLEPLGAETHVEVDADGAVLRARVRGFFDGEIGERVGVGFGAARVAWFDAASGRALS